MSIPVTPQDFSEIRWRGHWIWVPEEPIEAAGFMGAGIDPHARESHGLFRKTIQLDDVPERAPARITADSRYALFVNGQEVFRGPIRSQPRRMYYDLFDLAPYLQRGENVLAVYVKYYGTPKSYWMPAAPNLTLGRTGVMVFEAELGAAGWLVSDGTWKARKSAAWDGSWREEVDDPIGSGIPVEVFDARRMPYNWRATDFDDSAWGAAQVVPAMHIGGFARTQPPTDPYGPLYPRPIAKLDGDLRTPAGVRAETLNDHVDTTLGSPVRRVAATHASPAASAQAARLPLTLDVSADSTSRIVIDMGRIVSGLVQFEIDAPGGTTLDISYLEEPLKGPGRMGGTHAGTRYIARGAHDRMEVFDSNGFRYAYLLVHGAEGTVTLKHFAVRELVYPWQNGASFSCDDDELNRIYTAGIRTVQLNSHDAFLDCPTREQRAWVGDAVVHQMVHLATNQDWRLAWHYPMLADSPRSDGALPMSVVGEIEASGGFTIPDWALHWVHGVYNRYRFSGDQEAVKAHMPSIERVLRWYAPYQTAGGALKDVPEWNLVDWSSIYVSDTSALLTALWARGLHEFAEMAAWLEEKSSQRWAERLYQKAKDGFEMFWDERRGSYVDHIVGGEQRPEMSQLAGALAIVSGLAPQERWSRIADTITDDSRLVVRSWTGGLDGDYSQEKMEKQFRGIYETDWDAEREIVLAEPFMSYVVHDAVAQAGCAERLPDLYRRWSEFLEGGYDTIGECWGWGTHVHGWSCTPTRDMVFYTLGVTPAEPGYTKARIAPRLGRIKWAKGSVPTPHGLLTVEVSAGAVTIDSPVPVILDHDGQSRELPAGRHELAAS
ncbi:MAG TPA: family 78 glycoside hydrolase catalytic domain [Roseiflexaceae bacterium]|nr:family 78 glycoside hydrolase catalytic domain [Roseiflexaceae bacterium]